jgi:lysophospholipase L1-like esterase
MRPGFIKPLVMASSIAALAVVVTELSLRALPDFRPSYAQARIAALYTGNADSPGWSVPDDELGFLGKPLRHAAIETIDYSYTSESDEYGFANKGPWPERADVVFLGDSLLTGAGVGIAGQFTTLVAEQLPGYAVINLGLPGAAPEHQLRIFRRFGARLRPKLVVACLYVASDVDNAKHFDAWQKAGRQWSYDEFRARHYPETLASILGNERRAAATSEEDDTAGAGQGPRVLMRRAINATAVGRELLYLLEPWRKGLLHEAAWPDGSRIFLYTRFQRRLTGGIGNDYPAAAEVFFAPLIELSATVEAAGGAFVVALIPSKEELFAAPGNDQTLRIVMEVRQRLDALGMPVLDLYPAVAGAARTTAPFFAHDIHLNEAGNAAAANAIVEWIDRAGPAL